MKLTQWIFGIIALALLPVTVLVTGMPVGYFIDLPSAIIVLIGGYGLSLMSHGSAGLAAAYRLGAGRSAESASRAELASAAALFKGLGRNFVYFGIFGMIMGLISILALFLPAESFAKGLATLIITGLYAVIANILLVLPFRHRLEALLAEQ